MIIAGNRTCVLYSAIHPSPAWRFLTGPSAVGRVMVTRHDTVARVVAGTFEATLHEYQGPV